MKRLAYLGHKKTTFSYQAAQQLLAGGRSLELCPFDSHRKIYDAVCAGEEADLGLMAIENQIAGIVNESANSLIGQILTDMVDQGATELARMPTRVRIVDEVATPISLYLMNQSGDIRDIRRLQSHPVGISQSERFIGGLKRKLGLDELIVQPRDSTERAAEAAAADPSSAALSSILAVEAFGLKVIERCDDHHSSRFADDFENVTRFWVIERRENGIAPPASEIRFEHIDEARRNSVHKICVLFRLRRDHSGGLANALSLFGAAGINISILYPLPRQDSSWEYTFFGEFELGLRGDERHGALEADLRDDIERLRSVLILLSKQADFTHLGLFPKYRPLA